QTIVDDARQRGLRLVAPTEVAETPGEGIEGQVEGRHVVVGGHRFVASRLRTSEAARAPHVPGAVTVMIAIDGDLVGRLLLADELRDGTEALLQNLRQLGVERIVLATGDRKDVADAVASGLSIDAVRSQLTPDQKVLVVLSERKNGPVMMAGDGINDAPALA